MRNIILLILVSLFFLPRTVWAQGCIEASSEEGVNIIGYIQPEFRYDFLGEDKLTGSNLDESKLYFNRLRVGVVGNIPYDFSYYAVAELSPTLGGPYILDAFVSYNRFGPWAKISAGQFRTPFGIELSTPCHKLYTVNRSEVVSNLAAPFRDFGLMVSGGTDSLSFLGSKTTNFFGYQFAVLNGTGLNTPDNNRKKDILGRLTVHPVDFLTVGATYRFGKHPAQDAGSPDDERSRWGFDAEIKYKGLVVQGEYIKGSDIGSYTTGGGCGEPIEVKQGSVDRDGFFVQAAYMTRWNFQPVVKFETFDPNIADNPLLFEGSDTDRHNIITYGFNYFFNEWTRVQVNYLYKAEETADVEMPNDALLIQVQVMF
jgi:hypothetical protein